MNHSFSSLLNADRIKITALYTGTTADTFRHIDRMCFLLFPGDRTSRTILRTFRTSDTFFGINSVNFHRLACMRFAFLIHNMFHILIAECF